MPMVKQISAFLENKPGRTHYATKILADANINMRALSVADASDFGVLRLIVDKPEEAVKAFSDNNITAKISEVLAVEVPDVPGGMAQVLGKIEDLGIDLLYLYAFLGKKTDDAIIIFNVDDVVGSAKKLEENGIKLVKGNELYNL